MAGQASVIGRIKVLGSAPTTSAPSASVAAQAFGGATASGASNGTSSLLGFHGVGIKFWAGVAGVGLLLWVYHSLPE